MCWRFPFVLVYAADRRPAVRQSAGRSSDAGPGDPGVRVRLRRGLTGLIFGAVPAWLASRVDVNDLLKQNPQSVTAGRRPHRFRYALIVAEIAFTLIILAGPCRSCVGCSASPLSIPGGERKVCWPRDSVSPGRNTRSSDARRAFVETLHDRVGDTTWNELPFAIASSTVPTLPFGSSTTFLVEGRQDPVLAYNERVSPQDFDTLRIPLRRGRTFTSDDRARPHGGDGDQRGHGPRTLAQRGCDRQTDRVPGGAESQLARGRGSGWGCDVPVFRCVLER